MSDRPIGNLKNCKWIYRFRANPGDAEGRRPAAHPGLGPGSALGSRPRVALSSAQVAPVYSRAHSGSNSSPRRRGARTSPGWALRPAPASPSSRLRSAPTPSPRLTRSPASSFVFQRNNIIVESRSGAVANAPFPLPAHRTGRAVFRHPALGQDVTLSPTGRSSEGRSSGPGPARRAGTDRGTVSSPDSSACASSEAIDGADAAHGGRWLDTRR
jgi:hypothetical protein